tara:strand:- start:32775 stop:33068 length:294 start_codon:yes stop_codon:yes gene_type:complete
MRLIVSILVIGWLTSCSITQPTTTFVIKEEMEQVLDSVATARDSISKAIVIYNVTVIPPEPVPKGMSQENIRLIIAEAAGTISTIIAIMFVSNNPPQ